MQNLDYLWMPYKVTTKKSIVFVHERFQFINFLNIAQSI